MEEDHFIDKIRKIIKMRHDDTVSAMASGGVDSMETYKYTIGQINALESVRQEIISLLNDKEENEQSGTVIDLNRGSKN